MRIKLDLHPIFSEGRQIEAALQQAIDDACAKRASEIEIIPGKGSGALKKSVLRFLDRPEIKARYHRVEKDSDNWGRLFVHFRWNRDPNQARKVQTNQPTLECPCFCCNAAVSVEYDDEQFADSPFVTIHVECPSCGSPNRVLLKATRQKGVTGRAESGYTE